MNEATDKYWFVFWNDRLVMNRDPVGILSGSLPPLRGRVGTPPHEIGELDGRRSERIEALAGLVDGSSDGPRTASGA